MKNKVFLVMDQERIIYGIGETKEEAVNDFFAHMQYKDPLLNKKTFQFGSPFNNCDPNVYEVKECNVDCKISEIDAYTDYTII
jgi:hypothetical protein